MARYGTIFAGPVQKTMPQTLERTVDVATAPGSLVTINATDEFVVHGTQGVRGSFFILSESTITQDDTDTNIPVDNTGIGFYPEMGCFFHVLVETATDMTAEVTLLTSNGSGVLEVATTGDEVLFVAAETYNNTTGSNQLVLVRPYQGSVA